MGPRQAARPLSASLPILALPILALAAVLPARAAGASVDDPAGPPAGQAQPPAPVELYLEVSIDGQATGQLAPFTLLPATQGRTGLRSPVQNLRDLGLDPVLFGVEGQDSFDLDAVPGLHATYDAARQRIDLKLDDALRRPVALSTHAARPLATAADTGRGLLLNYSLHAETQGTRSVSAATELRYFDAHGVLSNTGGAVLHGGDPGYVRYDTTWTRSDAADLSTLEIGDVITPSLSWSRAMRVGGIQWRRNFALRPDLLTYPVASYGASAVVPSSVSLYVDGIRQFQASVAGGPYQVRDIAGVNGAGQATIVTEDALGRVTSTTLPLYVDTRLLEAGLTDYAVALGAPRRGYGVHSFEYGPGPVATASLRHGWSDALTLEGHAEASRHVLDAGAGALVRLGQFGVVSAALAGSGAADGSARGGYASLGYQYVARGWSLDALSERTSTGFADAGTAQGNPFMRASDRLNLNIALERGQSVSAGFINYKVPNQAPARIVSLSLASQLPWGLHLGLSAYRDLRRAEARGLQATLSLAFGGRTSGSATAGSQNGVASRTLSASSTPDVAGGFGWAVQKGEFGSQAYDLLQLQYLGGAGQLGMSTQSLGAARSTSVDYSGALVAMDGTVLPARHVGRGFALVATGVPGLPVLQEHRLIGTTDAAGRLLVPDLMPYTRNDITVDTTSLPADVHVATGDQVVVPRQAAGVVARFAFERYRAATVIVQGADGKPLPVGTVAALEGGKASVVGYDGMVFVEGVKAENVLIVGQGAQACRLRVAVPAVAPGTLPTVGPLICETVVKEQK